MQYCKSFPCPSLNRDSYWLSSPSTSSDSLHCLPVATLFRRLPWDAIVHFIATLGQVALSPNAGRSIQSLRHSHALLCKQLYINFVSSCSVLHKLIISMNQIACEVTKSMNQIAHESDKPKAKGWGVGMWNQEQASGAPMTKGWGSECNHVFASGAPMTKGWGSECNLVLASWAPMTIGWGSECNRVFKRHHRPSARAGVASC